MSGEFCPACGSKDIELEENGIMVCGDCGMRSKSFPKEELIGEIDEDDLEEEDFHDEIERKPKKTIPKKKVIKKKKGVKKK
jgi:transcription initiation factor TFIIIB Brf1 subunit/transcription initiation factor TFIIB